MKRLAAFTFIILAGASTQAMAAATAEEAARLTSVLQAYVGSEPGVVAVAPNGDSYDARIDFGPLFAKIPDKKVSISLSPIGFTMTSQGGGKWKIDQDQPFSIQFSVEGAVDLKGSIASLKATGIFDESLGAFSSSSATATQFAWQQTTIEGGQKSDISYTIATVAGESNTTGTGDNADNETRFTFTDLRETISVTGAPDGSTPPFQISIAAPTGTGDSTIAGFKPRAINDLLAWFVARPSPDAIKADQAALKDTLRAALPLWKSASTTSAFNEVSINSMIGTATIARFETVAEMTGIVDDARLRVKYGFSGLKMPEGIIPPFAANLVPKDLVIDLNVADVNLAAPAAMIIDSMDLNKEPPIDPQMQGALLGALLPKMSVSIGLAPSEIVANAYHLTAEGSMTAGPMAMPAGSALVKLKGIDDIMAAIQAAPPEMGLQQGAGVIILAKGIAKQEADGYLSWKIESTPTGSVTINGVDPTKMGGQ